MGKGSLGRIAVALGIICVYVYLFGIMGNIESLESNMPPPEETVEEVMADIPEATTTSATEPAETEMTVFTYLTELNVVNKKKPSLADYTATEAVMIIEDTEAPAAAVTTSDDLSFNEDDFDYTTPLKTTAPATTATEATTTAATTTLTAATTGIITTEAQTEAETTTVEDTDTVTSAQTEEASEEEEPIDEADDDFMGADVEDLEEDFFEEDDGEEEAEETEEYEDDIEEVPTIDRGSAASELVTVNAGGTIVTDEALTVVSKAVMAEIGDSFDEEAIKAQAVATYTYIKYYNNNNQNAYVVFKNPSDKVISCVSEVIGQKITYDGELIQSVYCASSAGYTSSSLNVWGVDYPYLRSVKTDFDRLYDINYGRTVTFSSDEVKSFIETNTDITLTGDPSEWLRVTSSIDGAYVGSLSICGRESFYNGTRDVEINGRVFRETVMEYNLRSASFDVSYDSGSDLFTFTTYGYGHGVGMSQHGANILASHEGYGYKDILTFYYSGTTIS